MEGSGSSHGSQNLDQLNRAIADVSIDPAQDGGWEVIGKKSKNRTGLGAQNSVGSGGSYWPQGNDPQRPVGRGNPRPQAPNNSCEAPYTAPPAIRPPLQHGWQWGARGGSLGSQHNNEEENIPTVPNEGSVGGYGSEADTETKQSDSEDDELAEESDDDLGEDYDSDASRMSLETRKKNRWFKDFFKTLDGLTVDELNEQSRQWHCPACHNGPGAIDWYKGLQPLMAHAKTKGATRVKLHRELAEVLEEELHRRGTSVIPAGEAFGKWKGLQDQTIDYEIVWPPMVVVMNTQLEKDEKDKWLGMGNQELLDYFSTYAASRAKHSYGPRGHRGISLLIFEPTAIGYLEAERLHKHFIDEGRDKDAWERRKVLFGPGGKRHLYGYLASKEDVDNFNQHSHGKMRTKFEMKTYQEMVVIPMRQMSEDNQQLIWYKNKAVKQEQRSKALQASFGQVSQKLRETMEENRIVRLRTKTQHNENKEQMAYQEQFYKEQIAKVHSAIEDKEMVYEKLLQDERAKAKEFVLNYGTKGAGVRKEASKFIDGQVKGVEEFEVEREKLILAHEEKKVVLRRKYLEEEVALEKEFDVTLSELMDKYAPTTFEAPNSS